MNDLWREQIIAFTQSHPELSAGDIALHYCDVWFSEELITENEIELAHMQIVQVVERERVAVN